MQPTRIEFDLAREDMVAAARVAVAQDRAILKANANNRLGSIMLTCFGILLVGGPTALKPYAVWIGFIIGCFLMLIGLALWPTRKKLADLVESHIKNAIRDPAWRIALGRRTVELHPDCLALEAGYGRSQVYWRAVVRTHRDGDYLTLTLPGPQLVPVPRAAFETDAAFDKFVDEAYRLIEAGGGNVGDSPPDDPDGAVPE